jgi:hypothetical protein
MEQTYQLLDAIIIVHLKSDTSGELPPLVLKHIGLFTEYLACLLSMYELILIITVGPYTRYMPLLRLSKRVAKSKSFCVRGR